MKQPITDYLRRSIKATGASLRYISRRSGVSEAILSRFMTSNRGMTLKSADKLAKLFRLEMQELLRKS